MSLVLLGAGFAGAMAVTLGLYRLGYTDGRDQQRFEDSMKLIERIIERQPKS